MKSERLWISPYVLTPHTSLNARVKKQDRHGVLVRLEEDGVSGYADLHPWPEIGDATLAEEIKGLAQARPLQLGDRTLHFARRDRLARSVRKSLFEGLAIPPSHRLVTDLAQLTSDELDRWAAEGFTHLKIKVGRDLVDELRCFREHAAKFAHFKIRIDWNELGTIESVTEWMSALAPQVRAVVEFLEDPIPYSTEDWKVLSSRLELLLAVDRESAPTRHADWMIIKPAKQAAAGFAGSKANLCITSYLDHPVGQMHAALEAAELPDVGVCGLVSHFAYAKNDFSEAFNEGPLLSAPQADDGIGFTALLERTDWRRLE